MRRTRKTSSSHLKLRLDMSVFDTAAKELGFALDEAQLQATVALASGDRDVYLWGPVGRGKSWLMTTYFEAVPTRKKLRIHFHEFFRDLHLAIRRHRNNLAEALDELLFGADIVCFDEFHVHDPADGIFVARLLPALLDRNIRIVLTSNYPPSGLLPNPLFHDLFLPTIDLIEQRLTVVTVNGPIDYRTISEHAEGFAAGWWASPGTADQHAHLGLHRPNPGESETLTPAGHPVRVRRAAEDCLWIDFTELCERTTAPSDYLALARTFRMWVISGVPNLRTAGAEAAQRFANVIDVLYDNDVTPVFLSSTPLVELAEGNGLPLGIGRVMSRLGQLSRLESESA